MHNKMITNYMQQDKKRNTVKNYYHYYISFTGQIGKNFNTIFTIEHTCGTLIQVKFLLFFLLATHNRTVTGGKTKILFAYISKNRF